MHWDRKARARSSRARWAHIAGAAALAASCAQDAPHIDVAAGPVPRAVAGALHGVRLPEGVGSIAHGDLALALREVELRSVLSEHAPDLPADARAGIAGTLAHRERDFGLDPLLVLAVIQQESRFETRARGPRGALGLMQVRPFVAADVAQRQGLPWSGATTLLEPVSNVRIGSHYLAEMLEMFGDAKLALAAYNMGPYRVRHRMRQGRRPEPAYVAKVLAHYAEFEARDRVTLGGTPGAVGD